MTDTRVVKRDYTGCNPNVVGREKDVEITRLRSENKRLRAELKIALSYLRAAGVNVEVCIGTIDEGVKRISDAIQETDNG